MEVLNAELQLQSGEADVTKGLLALNIAQDYFESLAAARPKILGSSTGTVTTTASTETTAFTAGLLRVDRVHLLGASTSRPEYELRPLRRTGGHAVSLYWPTNIVLTSSTGKPKAYWTNGTNFYWNPLPDATHTLRWYGFSAAANITAAGTFAYPDIVALPLAIYAVKLMKLGIDDAIDDAASIVTEVFDSTLDTLTAFVRDGAVGFEYTQIHDS